MLEPGLHIAVRHAFQAHAVGLAFFHAIVTGKSELPHREDRRGLKPLIGGREGLGLQIAIAGLLQNVGHRHEGLHILFRVLHLSTQRAHLFGDGAVIFAGRAFLVG